MKKNIKGTWYEVIEVIPKNLEKHDLFVCVSEFGYKECFQRYDWDNPDGICGRKQRWTN